MDLPRWLFEPNPPQAKNLRNLTASLYRRRGEGVILRRADARIGEWKPQVNYCAQNVDAWVRYNPHHKRVDGFVFFDYGVLSFVRFQPHCVLEVEDGALVDITPHNVVLLH